MLVCRRHAERDAVNLSSGQLLEVSSWVEHDRTIFCNECTTARWCGGYRPDKGLGRVIVVDVIAVHYDDNRVVFVRLSSDINSHWSIVDSNDGDCQSARRCQTGLVSNAVADYLCERLVCTQFVKANRGIAEVAVKRGACLACDVVEVELGDRQLLALSVGVVGEKVDNDRVTHSHLGGVSNCDRSIVDAGHGDRNRRRALGCTISRRVGDCHFSFFVGCQRVVIGRWIEIHAGARFVQDHRSAARNLDRVGHDGQYIVGVRIGIVREWCNVNRCVLVGVLDVSDCHRCIIRALDRDDDGGLDDGIAVGHCVANGLDCGLSVIEGTVCRSWHEDELSVFRDRNG